MAIPRIRRTARVRPVVAALALTLLLGQVCGCHSWYVVPLKDIKKGKVKLENRDVAVTLPGEIVVLTVVPWVGNERRIFGD